MHSLVGSVSVDKYAFGVINSSLSSRANERKEGRNGTGKKKKENLRFSSSIERQVFSRVRKGKKKKEKKGVLPFRSGSK